MLNQEEKKELLVFLKEYPTPMIKTASTILDGFASCIKPIPTICGAEVICSPNTYESVKNIIKNREINLSKDLAEVVFDDAIMENVGTDGNDEIINIIIFDIKTDEPKISIGVSDSDQYFKNASEFKSLLDIAVWANKCLIKLDSSWNSNDVFNFISKHENLFCLNSKNDLSLNVF
jgi:hypothetical protein